ncbi:MAG TPA: sigma-70 family RNA polymerase sigma factor [Kiloniellaceae bacterium]|nr:sigma-70 family RNA polymerase sigma factor [Kiloniellaceae bacterium]
MTAPTPPPPESAAARHGALLAAVAATGDRAAFAELFRHFAPRVKAYLLRGGAGAQQAEELAQETMLAVWQRAATFDPVKAAAGTWIFAVARNKRIDALRRERRPEITAEEMGLMADPAPPADRVAELTQEAAQLTAALAGLPPAQAELVRLAFFEHKTHGQIAAETALPLGTVKSRLRLALVRLRGTLAEDEA